MSDALDSYGVIKLVAEFPSKVSEEFIGWFTRSDDTIDGKSKQKAYALFDSSFIEAIEVGAVKGLQQIHAYLFGGLFGGLYDFSGQIRTLNIAKGGFAFAPAMYLQDNLLLIEKNARRYA